MAHLRIARTASGALSVAVRWKDPTTGESKWKNFGSAHDELGFSQLQKQAYLWMHSDELTLFEVDDSDYAFRTMSDFADWTQKRDTLIDLSWQWKGKPERIQRKTISTRPDGLWWVLNQAWKQLGFDAIGDEAFRDLVLARVIEARSTKGTVEYIRDVLGFDTKHLKTAYRAMQRAVERDYRRVFADACFLEVEKHQSIQRLLYDVTTLSFQIDDEKELLRTGISNNRLLDPQVLVGLLCDHCGFPLDVAVFPGNLAETKTFVPMLEQFQQRTRRTGLIVIADAGMLSNANIEVITDAGFDIIVGARISPNDIPWKVNILNGKLPKDLACGRAFEREKRFGRGKTATSRRMVLTFSP